MTGGTVVDYDNQATARLCDILAAAEGTEEGSASPCIAEAHPAGKAKRICDCNSRLPWCELPAFPGEGTEAQAGLPFGLFDRLREKLRARIVELRAALPPRALEDFRTLVVLIERCLERMQLHTDVVLHSFVEREKGTPEDGGDRRRYAVFWVHKLFRELEVVEDLLDRCPLPRLLQAYEDHLCDRFLDEEVLL
jgi:hypothetical protein